VIGHRSPRRTFAGGRTPSSTNRLLCDHPRRSCPLRRPCKTRRHADRRFAIRRDSPLMAV